MNKIYYRVGECVNEVKSLVGERVAGVPTEFKSWEDNITYKVGYHATIYGPPSAGKSYFVLHTLVKQAENHGYRSLLFTPEMGDRAEIVALLVEIKSGKTIYDIKGRERIGEEELELCLRWLNNHFIIIDSERVLTIENIYEQYEAVCREFNIHIDYICIDNLNDLAEPNYGTNRQDLNVETMYSYIRNQNKKLKCYTFLVTHTASQGAPLTQDGIRFYPPPSPREIRSGEAIYRKAYLLIAIWRPPYGLKDENGQPYAENETHVIVHKGKPANTATKGFVGKLFFNWHRSSFTDQPAVYKTY